MPKVKKQTAGKIGLMAAILYIIGNVIGIGIFFKNNTVFRLNDGNAIGVLVAWGISILIVLCMALSFAEISTCKMKNKNAGVGGWAAQFCGHSFGRYAKTGFNLIFWLANTFAVMFFCGEAILNCFAPLFGWDSVSQYDLGPATTTYVFLIGAAVFVLFMILNYLKSKAMTKAGSIISFVKFAPILMVVILGITFGVMINHGGAWANPPQFVEGEEYTGNFQFMGIISAIPAILFSFEGYISIGNISGDIENSEKNLPLAVVVGVAVISILYLLVTIGCITAGTGNVYSLMKIISGTNELAYKALTVVISIFIFICLIGCINGLCKGGTSAYQALADDGSLFKSRALVKARPGSRMFAGFVLFLGLAMLFWTILLIPSAILNTDAIADGSSTSMIVCLYLIYGTTVLGGLINRKTHKVGVRKIKIFPVAATIGVLGCAFMIVFVAFIQFLIAPIMNINNGLMFDSKEGIWGLTSGWGMFVRGTNCLGFQTDSGKYVLSNIEVIVDFWAMTAFMALLPIFNDLFIKWWDKSNKQCLIWQKPSKARRIGE